MIPTLFLLSAASAVLPTPLALECQTCHRAVDGQAIPALSRAPEALFTRLRALRDGGQEGQTMPRLLRGLSDDDLAALAREVTAMEAPSP